MSFSKRCGCVEQTKHRRCGNEKLCKKSCESYPISKATVIDKPGNYCLTNNILGDSMNPVILINADNVTLDLNSFQIDGNGVDIAVDIKSRKHITILNGSIVNTSRIGLNMVSCSDVELEDLSFEKHLDVSLKISAKSIATPSLTITEPSVNISVNKCNITKGNRAMLFEGCSILQLSNCNIYNNTNTVNKAILEVFACNNVTMSQMDVCNNNKAIPGQGAPVNFGDVNPNVAVVLVEASKNVTFCDSQVNSNMSLLRMSAVLYTGLGYAAGSSDMFFTKNVSANDNKVTNPLLNLTAGLRGLDSHYTTNLTYEGCHTDRNIAYNNSNAVVGTLASAITFATGNGSVVTYTGNNTFSVGQLLTIANIVSTPINVYNLSNVVIASATPTSFTVASSATGTYLSGGVASMYGAKVTAVSADGTFVTYTAINNFSSLPPPSIFSLVQVTGMSNPNYNLIGPLRNVTPTSFQIASSVNVGPSDGGIAVAYRIAAHSSCVGLNVRPGSDVTIRKCESNYNSTTAIPGLKFGGEVYGILVGGVIGPVNGSNVLLEDCVTNYNGGLNASAIGAGFDFTVGSLSIGNVNCTVKRHTSYKNTGARGGFGLIFQGDNVVVEDSQAHMNETLGEPDLSNNFRKLGAAGFGFANGINYSVKNCNAFSNKNADGIAGGFVFSNAGESIQPLVQFKQAKMGTIEKCTAMNNVSNSNGYGAGFDTFKSQLIQVKECVSVSNSHYGFIDGTTAPNINSFFGNSSEANLVAPYQNIVNNQSVFTKSTGTFAPTPPTVWTNISIV